MYYNQNNPEEINNLKQKIKELEQEKQNIIFNYSKINEDTQAQLTQKEKEINKLKNDYKILFEKINDLHNENNNLKNIIKIKQQEIEQLEKKMKKEIKKINDYEKKIQDYQKELKDTHSKYDQAINNFGQITNDNKELKKEIKSLNNIIKEKNSFESEANRLQNIIDSTKTKDDYLKKKAEDFYDVIIDIDSISSLEKRGWEVKYNQERKEIYDKIISEKTIKLGVLGVNNVGKSYLLSKIAKIDIPTGYSIETKGISIKYSEDSKGEEKGICILDSAGFETPLLIEKSHKEIGIEEIKKINEDKNIDSILNRDIVEDELSKDKAQTERFIEELIISLSDIIIVVVGKLTRTEQRLINRIKNLAKNNEKNKVRSMIIVHNLAQYHRIIEVENHINNYLLHSATFNLIKNDIVGLDPIKDRNYLVEKSVKQDDKDIEVYHYIMAKEGTEAGNYYNEITIKLIKQVYNHCNKRNSIDIPKEIALLFSDLSTEILGKKIPIDNLVIKENNIKLEENNNQNINNNKSTDTIIKSIYNLQNTYIDQDGKYLKNKEFEPKYSLYFYREEGEGEEDEDEYENYLLLRLEIPGNIVKLTARRTNPKTEKYHGIVIKGIKEREEFDEQKAKDFKEIIDNRKYGEFSYFIELKRNLEISKNYAKEDTKIYEFIFNKKNKDKTNKENKNNKKGDSNNTDNVEGVKIASGIYIMKFAMTQGSYA